MVLMIDGLSMILMIGGLSMSFLNRWIEHEDGSQDVAEDKNTPCGTIPPAKASMLNSCVAPICLVPSCVDSSTHLCSTHVTNFQNQLSTCTP